MANQGSSLVTSFNFDTQRDPAGQPPVTPFREWNINTPGWGLLQDTTIDDIGSNQNAYTIGTDSLGSGNYEAKVVQDVGLDTDLQYGDRLPTHFNLNLVGLTARRSRAVSSKSKVKSQPLSGW